MINNKKEAVENMASTETQKFDVKGIYTFITKIYNDRSNAHPYFNAKIVSAMIVETIFIFYNIIIMNEIYNTTQIH